MKITDTQLERLATQYKAKFPRTPVAGYHLIPKLIVNKLNDGTPVSLKIVMEMFMDIYDADGKRKQVHWHTFRDLEKSEEAKDFLE
jgi:hypothetical protein